MKRKTELITFRAVVVETETYKSEGKNLYHAVLDSLEGDVQRQAQFFGFDDLFKVGDIHIATFSPPVERSNRKAQQKNELQLAQDRQREVERITERLETLKDVAQIN